MEIDTFKVEEWCNKYEKHAKYNLVDNCIESLSINELLKISDINAIDEVLSVKLNYGEVYGSTRLRNAISKLYKKQNTDNITITHGAIGANELIYSTIIEPKGEVISILPAYQQHYAFPKSIGANMKYYMLKEENNWLPDIDELKKLITKKTKMIVLTNPNNPTGAVIQDDLMKEIINIADGKYIFVDEVYRGLVSEERYRTTSIVDLYENGIATSSLSKSFSLAGLRIGWIVCNKNLLHEVNKHREYNTISISKLDDFFASIALEHKDKIFERNLKKRKTGLEILKNWVDNESLIKCILPNGGTTAFAKYFKDISSHDLCKNLFNDTGVLFLPGETFEIDKYIRIGYCNNSEILKNGLLIFSKWLKEM